MSRYLPSDREWSPAYVDGAPVPVPGSPGTYLVDTSAAMPDERLLDWLRAVGRTGTWTVSVRTGAFVLAAAGLLSGRRATTHGAGVDMLAGFGAIPVRVVVDGHYATAAGVSAGIDLALTLGARIAGEETAQTVQLIIEYAPEPPFTAGSVDTAPPAVVQRATRTVSA